MNLRIAMTMLVSAVMVSLPQVAAASCPSSLVIDDFSSGQYKVRRKEVGDTGSVVQTGTMLGGRRGTFFRVVFNDFDQFASFEILKQPSILIVGTGIRTGHRLELYYGVDAQNNEFVSTPLNQDFTCFNKFRVHFEANSVALGLVLQVIAGNNPGVPAQCGDNILQGQNFSMDFPFDCFVPGAGPLPDFHDIDRIDVIAQTGTGALGASAYGITKIEAVP